MAPQPQFTKFARLIECTPVVVGQHKVQPIAKLAGWQIAASDSSFASALGRVTPHAIRVQEGDQEYTIPMVDPLPAMARGLVIAALAVSGFCLLMMFVAGRVARRQ